MEKISLLLSNKKNIAEIGTEIIFQLPISRNTSDTVGLELMEYHIFSFCGIGLETFRV